MSRDDEALTDMADEAGWTAIPDTDDMWAAPTELPPPLVDPRPPLLNTHEMGWEPFERLVLHMARTLDGAHGVRRYGRPGQAQHGLDVVGFFTDRAPSVYQAKDWQEFGADDLEKAVELYARGRRPFDADRIVIAVATEARDTRTVEKLADLMEKHRDLQIELWDRQEISDRLRTQPQLVTTHFGPATAAAFCATTPPPAAAQPPASIAADAILRGPMAHLQLGDDLRRADETLAERPDEAAELFATIADRLEASGFVPHAAPVREQQAKALRAAGRQAEEAWVRIDLGWRQLEAGDPFSAGIQVREIAEWGNEAPDNVVRCTNALSAVTGFRHEHAVTLDQVAEALDALRDQDPHRIDAALALAEEAVAARRQDLVEARAELLEQLAGSMPQDDAGQLIAARLGMCVADCGDGWAELVATARDTYPPKVTALVMARYARHLALVPEPEPSVARWRDAIERACVEGLNDDAADWLYALRGVRIQNGLIGSDINDLHRHAQALRGAGYGTLLPEPYRARERALAYLRDEKWPNALGALRRYLWRSVIGADWAGEIEAHELLGDLFARTGRGHEAVRHYVVAGQRKKLEALGGSARDEPVRLPIDLVTPRPWERAAAFAFAAACADLLVDEDARQWCEAAFREIVEHPQPAGFGAPDPWLAAFKAFGQLAVVSTQEQARRFLGISRELIPREPNRYRFTDEDQVHALVGIARTHPDLRPEAVDHLLQAVLVDQRMGELALREGHDLLREDPKRTVAAVGEAAAGGSQQAALALIAAEGETMQAVPLAHQRLEAAIAPRVHEPGVQTFGTGLSQTAALMTVLAEDDRVSFARGMLDFANDRQETAHNRYEALVALQGIASYIPGDARDELFGQVIPFAEGQHETPGKGELFPGADDPLQRFRFSFGEASLAPAGLMAAAALAHTDEQCDLLERIVRATAPTYPPAEYSDAGVWNREALEDALHDWVTARLLARGDLARMLAAATTISRLRSMLTTSFGQFLTNRRQRTSATNLFQRIVKILKTDGRFAAVSTSRSSAQQLWTLSESPADDIGDDEVQERLLKAASSKSDDDLGVIRYGPYSLKSSPILRNPALADFLVFLLGQAGCALSPGDLFRVLTRRFNLTEPARQELDPDTPDKASTVANKVETAILADSVLARIGKDRADLVRAVQDADGDLARAAASAGVSRARLAEALDYVMALIADYAETSDDAIAVYRRLTESLFLNGEDL